MTARKKKAAPAKAHVRELKSGYISPAKKLKELIAIRRRDANPRYMPVEPRLELRFTPLEVGFAKCAEHPNERALEVRSEFEEASNLFGNYWIGDPLSIIGDSYHGAKMWDRFERFFDGELEGARSWVCVRWKSESVFVIRSSVTRGEGVVMRDGRPECHLEIDTGLVAIFPEASVGIHALSGGASTSLCGKFEPQPEAGVVKIGDVVLVTR